MRVLGIDPGTAITGYGVLEGDVHKMNVVDYGCIRTYPDTPMPCRLSEIYRGLENLIEKYSPDAVSVEELFFNKNVTTALAVGQARGVVLVVAANMGLTIVEYTPLQVKQAVAGYGRADKHQMQQMVKLLLNLEKIPTPDDVADAIAVAICHIQSHSFQSLFRLGGKRL